jgi:hypothetical protein
MAGITTHLEVDDDESRLDSGLGSEVNSQTTSIASSVFNYRYTHGRRYNAHEDSHYQLPNDEEEMDRLEIQHRIWELMLNGKILLSPIEQDITRALDIGCGTGGMSAILL